MSLNNHEDSKSKIKKSLKEIKEEIKEKYGALQDDEFSEILFRDIDLYVQRENRIYDAEMQIRQRSQEEYRGVTLTFGQTGACDIECNMRMHNGAVAYYIMRPAQAIEYLHQLSSLLGLHLKLTPRDDFSSYRSWKDVNGFDDNYIGLESNQIGVLGYQHGDKYLEDYKNQKQELKDRELIAYLEEKIVALVSDKVGSVLPEQLENEELNTSKDGE